MTRFHIVIPANMPLTAANMQQTPTIKSNTLMSFLFNSVGWSATAAVFTALAAGSGGWALFLRTRDAKTSAAALAKYQLEAGERISKADKQAEEARKEAAKAMQRAAESNLETERIKERLAWREISAAQREDFLIAATAVAKGWVTIEGNGMSPEAVNFARQLAGVLSEAGFPVNDNSATISTIPTVGISFRFRSKPAPAHARFLIDAMAKLGVSGNVIADEGAGESVVISIGAKK